MSVLPEYEVLCPLLKSSKDPHHADHCRVQHEAEFFTMTGALMAKDTGAVDCLPPSQQQQVSPTLAASQPPSQPRLAQQPAPAKQAESEGTAAVWPSGWKPVNATAKPDSAHKEQQPSGSPEDAELEHLKKKKAKRKHEAIAGRPPVNVGFAPIG